MFTVLVVEERRRGIGRWLKSCRPKLEEYHTMNIPWRLIRAPCGAKGPDWKRIERLAGHHRAKLISFTEEVPPPESSVKLVKLYGFERIMAAKVLCRLLPEEKAPQTVGVIDPEGRCLSAVEILLGQAECVMVYTNRPERYEWFARRMLEQKGAPVVLCQNPNMMTPCRAMLLGGECPDWQQWVPQGCMVFSAVGQPRNYKEAVLHSFEPGDGPVLLSGIPKGVAPRLLCAALYELAAMRELAGQEPEFYCLKGQKLSVRKSGKDFGFLDPARGENKAFRT